MRAKKIIEIILSLGMLAGFASAAQGAETPVRALPGEPACRRIDLRIGRNNRWSRVRSPCALCFGKACRRTCPKGGRPLRTHASGDLISSLVD